jgi:Tol biopolymer transport system component
VRGRSLLPLVFTAFLIAFLICVSVGSSAAGSLSPAAPAQGHRASGTTLAVVRGGGASLYDDAGQPLLELPAGAPLRVDGRTPDNRWFHGAARDGTAGWASADALVIFGVSSVPIREGFSAPASKTPPAVTSGAMPAGATPSAGAKPVGATSLPATVASGTRLNVRSGPGTGYPVISTVAPGAALTAAARNAAGDWIRVQQAALPGGSGWVSASFLEMKGDAGTLPVEKAPAKPAAAQPAAKSAAVAGLTGKLVFQERSGGRIYVYDLANGSQRILTTGADPALSPDGRTVAFWRGDGADYGLYLIDVDGSNERRILTRTEKLRAPAWSPDGTKIAHSHVVGQRACRYVAYGICLPDTFPYNLLFGLEKTDTWGLARVGSDGGSYQDLAAVADALTPSWSERGIFYGGSGLQVTQDVSDESQNRAVLGEYRYQDPAAQPGGDRIVFHSLEKDHWEIYTANNDGSNVTALTRPATTLYTPLPHNVAPVWSPDGQHIVFLSNRTGQWKFWVMNPDGSGQRQLPIDVPIEYNYQAEQVVSWGN